MTSDLSDDAVTLLVTLRLRTEAFPTLDAVVRDVIAAARREDGCLIYEVHRSVADPERIVFYERWASPAHLSRHQAQDFMATFVEAATPFLLGEPETVVLQPLG